jgi:hypothetical protein
VSYEEYRRTQIDDHNRAWHRWFVEDLYHRGENRLGVEFKYDHRWRDTGNFYIETAEKARPRQGDYVPAGIFRNDNTWLWVQGDRDEVWVFYKHKLMALNADRRFERRSSATSEGYLLPLSIAVEYVQRILPPREAVTLEDELLNPRTAEQLRASVNGTWTGGGIG